MDLTETTMRWMIGGLMLLPLLLALHRPLERLIRLIIRTGVGLVVLVILSQIGALIGVHLGVNLFNALVLGLLGAPGLGLLLMLNWVLAI